MGFKNQTLTIWIYFDEGRAGFYNFLFNMEENAVDIPVINSVIYSTDK